MKDLFRMAGYVLGEKCSYGEKGPCIEVVVEEKTAVGSSWRKVLMLSSLFTKKGLEGYGTPFVFRIFPSNGKVTAEVTLNQDASEPSPIPDEIEQLLANIEEQDEQLREEQKN